jgi:hypothetical protein
MAVSGATSVDPVGAGRPSGEDVLVLGSGTVAEASFPGTDLRAHVVMGADSSNDLLLRALLRGWRPAI